MIRNRYGKIINISSSAAKHFFPGFGAYAASKGGIVSFTHTPSEEVKQYGINVNAIYLGTTNTEHTRERMDSDQAVTIDLDSMLQVEGCGGSGDIPGIGRSGPDYGSGH